jgi:hypothetical protein
MSSPNAPSGIRRRPPFAVVQRRRPVPGIKGCGASKPSSTVSPSKRSSGASANKSSRDTPLTMHSAYAGAVHPWPLKKPTRRLRRCTKRQSRDHRKGGCPETTNKRPARAAGAETARRSSRYCGLGRCHFCGLRPWSTQLISVLVAKASRIREPDLRALLRLLICKSRNLT